MIKFIAITIVLMSITGCSVDEYEGMSLREKVEYNYENHKEKPYRGMTNEEIEKYNSDRNKRDMSWNLPDVDFSKK